MHGDPNECDIASFSWNGFRSSLLESFFRILFCVFLSPSFWAAGGLDTPDTAMTDCGTITFRFTPTSKRRKHDISHSDPGSLSGRQEAIVSIDRSSLVDSSWSRGCAATSLGIIADKTVELTVADVVPLHHRFRLTIIHAPYTFMSLAVFT